MNIIFFIFLEIMVFLLSGFVQGAMGFGFALVAVPLLSAFLPIRELIPIITIIGAVISIQLYCHERQNLDLKRIRPLIISGIVGTFAGSYALIAVDPKVLKSAAGMVIIATAIMLALGFRVKIKKEKQSMLLVGLISGLLQGSISLAGPPFVLFLANMGTDKDTFRANVCAYFLILSVYALIIQAIMKIVNEQSIKGSLIFIPCAVVGNYFGIKVSSKLKENVFKKVVLVLIAVTGLISVIF